MRRLVTVTAFFALCTSAATADPFAAGDVAAGKALHDAKCSACHGSNVYTRADRKIKSAKSLALRVAACNANSNAGMSAQEELDVAAYLNQQFYKFK